MSNEEEKKLRLNCFSDFQRSAVSYISNPLGKTHLIFINHGVELIRILGVAKLTDMCEKIKKKLISSKTADIRLADKILMVGILAKG